MNINRLNYVRLELKRAVKRLPAMFAGAMVLLAIMGTIAFLASRVLYGESVTGRIQVGVALPKSDLAARQVVSMLGSLDSVKSICDFHYVEREKGLEKLRNKEFYAVMDIPEGFVESIINGTNTPVPILFSPGDGVEGPVFRELAQAGAKILGSSQAGIYAAGEWCVQNGFSGEIPQVEADLNRIYLGYSLPRMDYFEARQVSATGEVEPLYFYGISAFVLFLFFATLPVNRYLQADPKVMQDKLALQGIGKGLRILAKGLGLTFLLLVISLPLAALAMANGLAEKSVLTVVTVMLICAATAFFTLFIYQAAGSLLGGIMLLFLVVTGMHILSGGFLPMVFLPDSVRRIAPFLPSWQFMEAAKMAVTGVFSAAVLAKLLLFAAVSFWLSMLLEVVRS